MLRNEKVDEEIKLKDTFIIKSEDGAIGGGGNLQPFFNVLSLFDGMSCGQIALNRIGIKVDNYFASEIDKNAIKVTMKNYPNTIQVGDVTSLDGTKLPKITLLIAGSPCQDLSRAKVGGRGLSGDKSKLFWEIVRIKEETNPKYFILENVKMNKENIKIISEALGVEHIEINSNLVSAQNRTRLYWTNIKNVTQPIDKKILLSQILETNYDILKKYKVNKTPSRIKMWEGKCKNITHCKKSNCVVTKQDRWNSQGLIEFEDFCRFLTPNENERLQTVPDNYTKVDGVSDLQRDFMLGNGFTVDVITHILSFMPTPFVCGENCD